MKHSIEVIDERAIEQMVHLPRAYPVVIALPTLPCLELIPLMQQVSEAGFEAIPTIPARRITDETEVGKILGAMNQLSLKGALLVGGNDTSSALFQDSIGLAIHCMNRHESPLRHIYFAAHPEGTIEQEAADLISTMKQKEDMCLKAGLKLTFVTQLCLSADAFISWIKLVRAAGIVAPIQIGISTSCSHLAMTSRLQFCFDARKARLIDSYQTLGEIKDGFVPRLFVHELQSRINFQQMNICGYHWYGFDTLQNVMADIESVSME